MNQLRNLAGPLRRRTFSIVGSALLLAVLFATSGIVSAQRRYKPPAAVNPDEVSIDDVCAAAVPRESQGTQFQWSPDAASIAYFKPMEHGFGLRLELDLVNAAGSERSVLLSQQKIDELFPARSVGETKVAPPRASVGFQWTPDGNALLLHSNRGIVWLDRKTLKTRNLVTGKELISDVQLSPDGRSAAFASDHNLWVVSVTGGEPRAVTKGGNATLLKGQLDWLYPNEMGTKHGYAWSPDSTHIAWLEFNLKGVATYTPPFASDDEAGHDTGKDSPLTIDYPTPGTRNPVLHVFVSSVNDKTPPVAINTGKETDVYLPRLQWLPDSKQVAVERLNRPQNRLDLLIADARTGVSRVAVSDTDPYWINLTHSPYFFKSSPQFIWSSERSGYRHLYLYSLDGKLVRPLTQGNWEVTSLDAVNESEAKFYFTSTEKGALERHIYMAGLDGKDERRISGDSGTHDATFAPGAALYVDNFSTALKPWIRSVYRVDAQSKPASEINANAHPAAIKVFALDEPPARKPIFQPVNFMTIKTHDGADMNAFMVRPAGFAPEKKYPAIVYVYGGPGRQAVRDVWDGDVSMWRQMLAQRGYVVFAVDNRGTGGRGHAYEEFIHLRFEGQEMTDQKDAVAFLKTLPYIDPNRVGIWGRGFGGALAVHSMLHPPLVVKSAFAIAPVVNWMLYDSAFTERYLGDPVRNQDGYLSSTPLDEWQRYKGPMFVAQGADDLEVHPDQMMELQEDLVEHRKYLEVSLFPGQSHAIDDPNACSVLFQHATDFFAASLAAAPTPSAP